MQPSIVFSSSLGKGIQHHASGIEQLAADQGDMCAILVDLIAANARP
jgi:hypothetical protein